MNDRPPWTQHQENNKSPKTRNKTQKHQKKTPCVFHFSTVPDQMVVPGLLSLQLVRPQGPSFFGRCFTASVASISCNCSAVCVSFSRSSSCGTLRDKHLPVILPQQSGNPMGGRVGKQTPTWFASHRKRSTFFAKIRRVFSRDFVAVMSLPEVPGGRVGGTASLSKSCCHTRQRKPPTRHCHHHQRRRRQE